MKGKNIRINRISIRNYKGLDQLDIDFTLPKMPHDPDLMIMGSKNGVGKTSVIECCALLLFSLSPDFFDDTTVVLDDHPTSIPDLLIKAGSNYLEISGDIDYWGEELKEIGIRIHRNGKIEKFPRNERAAIASHNDTFERVKQILGFTPNPVIENLFLLFHSYRKVQEGSIALGRMVNTDKIDRNGRKYESPMNVFKLLLLRLLMAKADLFERVNEDDSESIIEKLNELVDNYAGGTIGKLLPSSDDTLDFRINMKSANHDESQTFSFDSLSSGQKEIISTLFLIWYHTRDKQSVVFIDEPELHLNSHWHGGFVNMLTKMAPNNQYIIATHSEYIMDSVENHQRIYISHGDKKP